MDFEEEQRQEIESLSYIYQEHELKVDASTVTITLVLDNIPEHFPIVIGFTLPETYPETAPDISLECEALPNEEDFNELLAGCKDTALGSLGMGSMYTIASFAKERAEDLIQIRKQKIDEAEDERKRIEEELEAEKYRGTRVTPESFKQWKINFLNEAKDLQKQNAKLSLAFQAVIAVDKLEKNIVDKSRLSGRLMFERNAKLVESDALGKDEDGEDVDYSKYERSDDRTEDDEEENEVLQGFKAEKE